MNASSERAKKALIKARNTIRKKFRELHNQRLNFKYRIKEEFKPITKPLKKLVEETATIKQEKKDEEKEIKNEPKWSWNMPMSMPSSSKFKTAKKAHFSLRRYKNSRKTRKSTLPQDEEFYSPDDDDENEAGAEVNISGVNRMDSNEDDDSDTTITPSPYPIVTLSDSKKAEGAIKSKITRNKTPSLEVPYGFRMVNNELLLGNDTVTVRGEDPDLLYRVNGRNFPITNGLTQLLLEGKPNSRTYNNADLKVYRDMLLHTSAHKYQFRRYGTVVRDINSPKYNNIIKALFPSSSTAASDHGLDYTGAGGCMKRPQTIYKSVIKKGGFNYTYWDDPNELVNRLRILFASKSAGHTGHENEMISIIEELREAKIIK